MVAEDWIDYTVDLERWDWHPKRPVNKDPEVWITAKNEQIHIDEMTESHVRNTLKCILRHAHEGKVWAIKPEIGGLRHYNKGDPNVASVLVNRIQPRVVDNPWDEVESVTLVVNRDEASAIASLAANSCAEGKLLDLLDQFRDRGLDPYKGPLRITSGAPLYLISKGN